MSGEYMLDHLGIGVTDLEESRRFYEEALAPLDFRQVMTADRAVGFGRGEYPEFWIDAKYRTLHMHIAFKADNRKQVDEFYRRAIGAGARDNGAPGIRVHYHPDYYAAFVLDPDGFNVEAVCRKEE
jgi:catechol 2,3-dioxygenase-like lactoylglutathione lyase family enzyme